MERDSNEAYIFEKGYPGGSKMRLGKILHVWTLVILARKLAFESEILADFFNFSQKKFLFFSFFKLKINFPPYFVKSTFF